MLSPVTIFRRTRNALRALLLALSMMALAVLSSCSPAPPAVRVLEQPPSLVSLPLPVPLQPESVQWEVLTPKSLPSGNWSRFALTPEGYEALARNQADEVRWMTEALFQLHRAQEISK